MPCGRFWGRFELSLRVAKKSVFGVTLRSRSGRGFFAGDLGGRTSGPQVPKWGQGGGRGGFGGFQGRVSGSGLGGA